MASSLPTTVRRAARARYRSHAFTLIEILVVIAIISLISTLLLSTFSSVREKARSSACLSNLHQIGLSMTAYMQDYDGAYPWGADPSDKYTNIWSPFPSYYDSVQSMPLINVLLEPYVRNHQVWRCPSDTGFDYLDTTPSGYTGIPLAARPTMFDAFGTSYMYRTEIALKGKTDGNLTGLLPSGQTVGPAQMNVLMDSNGGWHGSRISSERRYNVLMGDGHAVSQSPTDFFVNGSWAAQIE